jgi:metal-dependent hydrolase (beta-lactamase superfamily II)
MRTGGIALTSSTASGGRRRFLHFARNIFKGVPLSTVMGGFRLSRAEIEAIIPDTIQDFGKFALKRIVPCHRPGWRAVHAPIYEIGSSQRAT